MSKNNNQSKIPIEIMLARARELQSEGLDYHQAWQYSDLEERIRNWPSSWGENLQVLIYGDFKPPDGDLFFEQLGITLHSEKQENTIIRSAYCVLEATVTIKEKSISAIIEAIERLNIFLGILTLVNWGNQGFGWWSYVTHGTSGGIIGEFKLNELLKALDGYKQLPESVQKRINSALYWIREPHYMLLERHRNDVLRIFAAYWNAFECLVESVILLRPQKKLSRHEKQNMINKYFEQKNCIPKVADIEKCYQEIVNPGFVGKATYALRFFFGDESKRYIDECFKLKNRHNRLYDIRNAINHGDIDAENAIELSRIESRLRCLWMIVWGIFGRIIPIPTPVDRPLDSSAKQ